MKIVERSYLLFSLSSCSETARSFVWNFFGFMRKKKLKRREPMNCFIVQKRWEKLSGKKERKEVEVEEADK